MELPLIEAFKIAVEVHGNQRDKAGEPYLFHVMRVAMAMDTDKERAVALLHDAIEDCPAWLSRSVVLYRSGSLYGDDVAHAIAELTRVSDEPYMDYIRRLSTNPLAVKVKLADLRDNMQRQRLRKLPAEDAVRLLDKYTSAYCFLWGKQWEHEDAARGDSVQPKEN